MRYRLIANLINIKVQRRLYLELLVSKVCLILAFLILDILAI